MEDYKYNNDPKLVDELIHVRSENASFFREINSLKDMNEFLRKVIETLISNSHVK